MKFNTVILNGALYAGIAALTPVAAFLASQQPITTRTICAISVASIIAGATALKAFISTSNQQPPTEAPKS